MGIDSGSFHFSNFTKNRFEISSLQPTIEMLTA